MHSYEKREWPKIIWMMAALIPFAGLTAVGAEEGTSVVFSRDGVIMLGVFSAVMIFALFARGSVLVSASREGLFVRVGHFPFAQRRIALDNIKAIQRTKIPWYRAKTTKGFWTGMEQYCVSGGDAFTVMVKEGKPLTIQARDREEIFKVLKNLVPDLDIS